MPARLLARRAFDSRMTIDDSLIIQISLRLHVKQLRILPVELHQLSVGSLLDDLTVLEHQDFVRVLHGAEAMRDEDDGLALHIFFQRREDFFFRQGVDLSGRLVEDCDRGVSIEHPGDG
jgi:hypothetical protein